MGEMYQYSKQWLFEFCNFHLVLGSNGYFGNFHVAFNFAYGKPHHMMALRPILFRQAMKKGIDPEQYAFSGGKK